MKKVIYLSLLILLIGSCAKESLLDVSVDPLPVLKFEDSGQMFGYFSSIVDGENAFSDRKPLQLDSDFKSFKEVYYNALDQLSEVESDEQHDLFLENYSDVIQLVDSTYVPKITNPFYQVICNREGIYVSDGYAHKVMNSNLMVITDVENINDLQEVHSVSGLDLEVFRVVSYNSTDSGSGQERMNANCGTTLEKDYFNNNRRCKNDRRVYIRAHAFYGISGYQYTPSAISEAWGKIRSWRCKWKDYRTNLNTRNCSFTVSATLNGNTYSYPMTFSNRSATNARNILLHQGAVAQPITWQGGHPPSIQFTKVRLEATSRGVGNNWVIINCQ